ncbi:MAG: WHG domain-containing protein [Spirochaetales bacterium]|nr:MAG: WHG domain-containing protein [Spirochaetales bacterium]
MAQRKYFDSTMILETAFIITQESGWQNVTARTIAKRLGSSTMPIYSEMKSMQDIEKAVQEKAQELLKSYQTGTYTDNSLLNLAVGYVVFSMEEPRLFHFLFMDRNDARTPENGADGETRYRQNMGTARGIDELMAQIPASDQDSFILESWIFTHGLASLLSGGVLSLSRQQIIGLLDDAGGAFYTWHLKQREKIDE